MKRLPPNSLAEGEGTSRDGTHWVHIGTDDTYIALSESRLEAGGFRPYSGVPGVTHLAYVVDDVDALRTRLAAAGYKDSTPPNVHSHRKRQYSCDLEGNDWEFV